MLFNKLYKCLHSQYYTPYMNSQLRLWWSQNSSAQQHEYLNIMHQFLGSNWLNHLQLIDMDNFMIKRLFKVALSAFLLLILFYVLM